MENEKKWTKPEMTIIFSGNVDEHVMKRSFGKLESNEDEGGIITGSDD